MNFSDTFIDLSRDVALLKLLCRAMYAIRDINEGETVLTVKCVAAVLEDPLMSSHCSGCFVDISGNQRKKRGRGEN
jgi:hypothetical protein